MGTDAKSVSHPDDQRQPVGLVLKTKIVTFLSRSRLAANSFPQTLAVIFHCMYGADANVKLKQQGMWFVQFVFQAVRIKMRGMKKRD